MANAGQGQSISVPNFNAGDFDFTNYAPTQPPTGALPPSPTLSPPTTTQPPTPPQPPVGVQAPTTTLAPPTPATSPYDVMMSQLQAGQYRYGDVGQAFRAGDITQDQFNQFQSAFDQYTGTSAGNRPYQQGDVISGAYTPPTTTAPPASGGFNQADYAQYSGLGYDTPTDATSFQVGNRYFDNINDARLYGVSQFGQLGADRVTRYQAPQPTVTPPAVTPPTGGQTPYPQPTPPVTGQPPATGGKGGGVAAPQRPNIFQQSAGGLSSAMAGTQNEMFYRPMGVTPQGYLAPDVSQGIGAFFNPFEQQVVQNTLGDIERQRQMQENVLGAQFQQAGAFGGSREAIRMSELDRASLGQAAQTAAQLRQGGFNTALGAAQQQAQMGQRAAEFGLDQRLRAQLANQQAFQQAAQQRLNAASQLGTLSNLGFTQGQAVQSQLQQQGALQRALQQQIMDAGRAQFEGFRNYPVQALGYYAQALGASPQPQTQTTSNQLGLMDYLTAGIGAAGAFGFSDRRLKANISKVGALPTGQSIYSWTWNEKANDIGLTGTSVGVMADETDSALVTTHSNGYQMVNYGALLA